jgi:hypothetical protein
VPNPAEDWISERAWNEILTLPALPTFARFAKDFRKHLEGFKRIFDSSDPHRYNLDSSFSSGLPRRPVRIISYCSIVTTNFLEILSYLHPHQDIFLFQRTFARIVGRRFGSFPENTCSPLSPSRQSDECNAGIAPVDI